MLFQSEQDISRSLLVKPSWPAPHLLARAALERKKKENFFSHRQKLECFCFKKRHSKKIRVQSKNPSVASRSLMTSGLKGQAMASAGSSKRTPRDNSGT